jgi:hypothetical protein
MMCSCRICGIHMKKRGKNQWDEILCRECLFLCELSQVHKFSEDGVF